MSHNNDLEEGSHSEALLEGMRSKMLSEGKAEATISKYLRDARRYLEYAEAHSKGGVGCLDQITVREYRDFLSSKYKKRSINSMLAGTNYLFGYCGRDELKLRAYRIQRDAFRDDSLLKVEQESQSGTLGPVPRDTFCDKRDGSACHFCTDCCTLLQ